MENRFIVKKEDVQEFLKEKLGLEWDGYIFYYGIDKIHGRMMLVNKHEARFVDNKGNPSHLVGFMAVKDSKGKIQNYSLSVDRFLYLEVMKFEKSGLPSKYAKAVYDKEWAFFLINKYGKELKEEILDYHKKHIDEDSNFLHTMIKKTSNLYDKIQDEKQLVEEIDNSELSL